MVGEGEEAWCMGSRVGEESVCLVKQTATHSDSDSEVGRSIKVCEDVAIHSRKKRLSHFRVRRIDSTLILSDVELSKKGIYFSNVRTI